MPDSNVVMAYLCECGKKWSLPRKSTGGKDANTSFKCDCGRTIVVYEGVVYAGALEKKAKAKPG
jgi:hypothetical protein